MPSNISRRELENIESEWVSNPSPILCARFADILRQMGRYDESRDVADTGLKRWKNNTSITIVLAKCYLDSGLFEKALESFIAVHSAQPQNLVALRNIAEIHFQKENWSEALEYLEEYLFEHPGDEEVRDKLEEARSRMKSSAQMQYDTEEDLSEQEEDIYPQTDRMNKILESQGINTKPSENPVGTDSAAAEVPFTDHIAPGSLLGFFSDEERDSLNLKPYDSEDE